jgi:hypothetical protein
MAHHDRDKNLWFTPKRAGVASLAVAAAFAAGKANAQPNQQARANVVAASHELAGHNLSQRALDQMNKRPQALNLIVEFPATHHSSGMSECDIFHRMPSEEAPHQWLAVKDRQKCYLINPRWWVDNKSDIWLMTSRFDQFDSYSYNYADTNYVSWVNIKDLPKGTKVYKGMAETDQHILDGKIIPDGYGSHRFMVPHLSPYYTARNIAAVPIQFPELTPLVDQNIAHFVHSAH